MLVAWLHYRQFESTDDAFIDGHIVQVSPKVSGIVLHVNIDDNSQVSRGQVLVELDPSDFDAALTQAQGNYDSAEGKLAEAQAQVKVAEANVQEAEAEQTIAEANAQNAQDDLNRYLALDERARSRQQLDSATAAQRTRPRRRWRMPRPKSPRRRRNWPMRRKQSKRRGESDRRRRRVEPGETQSGLLHDRAETDGVITRKDVEPGMYIQVDQPMFSIVQYDVWVIANFKETQLARIYPDQPVDITVDAYPGRHLLGKVQSIQNGTGSRFTLLPPENATGNYVKIVQRVPVKIVLDPGQNQDRDHLLSPGMSVDPSIKVR